MDAIRKNHFDERKGVTLFILAFLDFLKIFLEKHNLYLLFLFEFDDIRKRVEESRDGIICLLEFQRVKMFVKRILDIPDVQKSLKMESTEYSTVMNCKYLYLTYYERMMTMEIEEWIQQKEMSMNYILEKV
jgi:hypothetical protein